MASLYEIDFEIMNCIDFETGEVVDVEKLTKLQMDREHKIESVALWVKNLRAEAAAYKAEKDAFAKREKRTKNKVESLEKWLTNALNGEKLTTNRVAISFRKSKRVEVLDDSKIPENYMTETVTIAPDKKGIREAIEYGLKVPGCELVERNNIQIE